MNTSKLFLEQIKYMVENHLPLNEYIIEQLQINYQKSKNLIKSMFHLFEHHQYLLPFVDDIEATAYEYLVNQEMKKAKTYFGATLYVADLFDETQTYIRCKVEQCKKPSPLILVDNR